MCPEVSNFNWNMHIHAQGYRIFLKWNKKGGKRALQTRNVLTFNIFVVDKSEQILVVLACLKLKLETQSQYQLFKNWIFFGQIIIIHYNYQQK